MRGTEFLDKMELINPTYVEEADVKPKKKSTWIKLGTVAACLCLMAVGALSIVKCEKLTAVGYHCRNGR